MAIQPSYTPPKNPEELDKRKELASVLKQFARNEIKVDPEQMVKAGADMGVSRSQLSGLYQKYRKDFEANPPESTEPNVGVSPTQTGVETPRPDQYDVMQKAPIGVDTPRLNQYDAMQKAPIGSSSSLGQRRSLESEGGKYMRMARKLQRKGYGNAADKMAFEGARLKMTEPSIRTEAYREQQSALQKETQMVEQKTLEEQNRALELQRKLIEERNKRAITEMRSPQGLSPETASLFNK